MPNSHKTVRPERVERPTYWFVASCSIHFEDLIANDV
jgi:hypothetical protein